MKVSKGLTSQLEYKVACFIEENNLINKETSVIIGVSGGADSVALVNALHNLGYECILAHCNFHLRGSESIRDEHFVESLASKYNLKLEKIDFATEQYAAVNSLSIEMAARELRYQWFEQLRNKHAAQAIVVAHHKDDNAETVLLNLIRGTGIRGLSGIKPVNGTVVRPFLCVSRSEILDYLDHSHLDYVTDSTNLEDEYTRNFIRLNVIPLLSKINPSVLDSINKTSLYLDQAEKVYTNAIQEQKQQLFIDNKVNIASLLELPSPKAFLFELLSDYGFNENQVADIYHSLNAISGKFFLSKTHRVIKDRETLIVTPLPDEENEQYYINDVPSQTTHPIRLSFEVISDLSGFNFERDKSVAYFDLDKIALPLQLRRWNRGDRFYPFGMKGAKKISDYFNDRKFSLEQKEATWLLCSAGDIVWIIGERSDNRVRVTDSTKKILKVKFFLTN